MDEVVRQQDPEFLDVLNSMQNGAMKESHANFLLLRCLAQLSPEEKDKFKDAIHMIPTWKQTVPITVQYLKQLNVPIAKAAVKLLSNKVTGKNHCIKDCLYPILSGVGVGAVVMLLKNYVAELGIVNGCVNTVKKVVYRNRDGPREPGALPVYAIINFPSIDIPEEKKFFPDAPRTTVPVSVD
eukprot:6104439-Ditylum_brightwellii.AAC.1